MKTAIKVTWSIITGAPGDVLQTSLNPCYTVGFQIMEAIKVHQGGNKGFEVMKVVLLLRPRSTCSNTADLSGLHVKTL
ncbi:hypothetical protein O5833_29760, partial [Escherichia coli]|nr:hypothetical protein [Escherichia coli]